MQRNFILTDVMKTGYHIDLEAFVEHHSLKNQSFDMTGEYYTLHEYDLESYDRRFAVIDTRRANDRIHGNTEFDLELRRRCDLLHSQGFVFIKATPWESLYNIKHSTLYPEIDIDHIKWSGGVSWFWFYMRQKHMAKSFNFDHGNKKFDFLYLNKFPREHRKKMFQRVEHLLANSLYSNWEQNIKLSPTYELPWAQDYPKYGRDQDIFEKPYNDTKYSLVAETNDTNDEIFMTEKIWKPIIAQQPFVVHGNYLYLQRLREMGFKTFANYFDEGYDLEADADKRIDKIVTTCQDLLTRNWQDIYLQTQALRKHNLDTFFNREKLSIEINKTLNLFLEFADSR
jgi:hypothetical protein